MITAFRPRFPLGALHSDLTDISCQGFSYRQECLRPRCVSPTNLGTTDTYARNSRRDTRTVDDLRRTTSLSSASGGSDTDGVVDRGRLQRRADQSSGAKRAFTQPREYPSPFPPRAALEK